MLRGVACVICYSNSFHSFIFKLCIMIVHTLKMYTFYLGAQWLSGRVLDSRPKGRGLEPHRRHCVVSLSKNINPSLVLVQPRKTRPFITERLLRGRKELNQTNKHLLLCALFMNFCSFLGVLNFSVKCLDGVCFV